MGSLTKRALLIACLMAAGMSYYYFATLLPRAHAARTARDLMRGYTYGCDFYPIWLTSHELLSNRTNPYTPEMTTKIQMGLFGRTMDPNRPGDPPQNLATFPHPLYTDFLVAPLAPFSFHTVQIIGTVLFPLFVIVGVFHWLSALSLRLSPETQFVIVILTLSSYPVLEGIYALQITLLVAALLAGSIAAMVKGRQLSAGVLFGIATVKPQLMILPGLFLVLWAACDLRNRKTFIASFAGTLVGLFVISELVLPGWTAIWLHALLEYRQYNDGPLSQLIFGNIAGKLVSAALIVSALALAFRVRRAQTDSPQFISTLILLLAISVPTIPSSIAVYNQILCLPGLLWLAAQRNRILHGNRNLRLVGYAVGALIAWPWIAASCLTLASVLLPKIQFVEWVVVLPLRTAPSVPFAVIALFFLAAWKTGLYGKRHTSYAGQVSSSE
jgi:Glycosyltransferase family 87